MAGDLDRLFGPRNRPEPSKKKDEPEVNTERFREMMGKVGEAGPEEQGKRKRKDEQEADLAADMTTGFVAPPDLPTSNVTEEDNFKITLDDKTPRANLGATSRPPARYGAEAPPTGETYGEEAPPPAAPAGYSSSVPTDQTPSDTSYYSPPPQAPDYPQEEYEPSFPEVEGPQQPYKQQQPEQTQQQQQQPTKAAKKGRRKAQPPGAPVEGPAIVTAPPKEKKAAPAKGKAPVIPETPEAPKGKKPPKKAPAEAVAIPALPTGAWETKVEKVKEKEKEPTAIQGTGRDALLNFLGAPAPAISAFAPEAPSPYFRVPQIFEMFERMVGVMTVMTAKGITQTTLTLSAPQFAGSKLFGAEISITEFSTAPKVFNIEIRAPEAGKALIDKNVPELVAAFQAGQYTYRVNRIDTALLPTSRAERQKVQKPKGRS